MERVDGSCSSGSSAAWLDDDDDCTFGGNEISNREPGGQTSKPFAQKELDREWQGRRQQFYTVSSLETVGTFIQLKGCKRLTLFHVFGVGFILLAARRHRPESSHFVYYPCYWCAVASKEQVTL